MNEGDLTDLVERGRQAELVRAFEAGHYQAMARVQGALQELAAHADNDDRFLISQIGQRLQAMALDPPKWRP